MAAYETERDDILTEYKRYLSELRIFHNNDYTGSSRMIFRSDQFHWWNPS